MSLVSAALGIIIGTICFALGGLELFIPALIVLSFSTTAFSSYARYRNIILACLGCILLSYFNYHLRADWLEIQDPEKLLNSGKYQLEVVSKPRNSPYFESEFIVELKPLKLEAARLILPYRLLAKTSQAKGLELGDIIELDRSKNPKAKWQIEELSDFKRKVLRKDKVFKQIKNKNLSYLKHSYNPVEKLQKTITNIYQSQMTYENSQIVTSLLLGSRVAKLPDEFNSQVRNLGLSHIFAASGFNLLIISATLAWIFSRLRLRTKTSSLIIIASSVLYTALAGFSPSIVRACIFVTAFMILKALGRKPLSVRFLILLAGLILAVDPYAIFDIGFQLSYLATLSLILFASPISERLKENKFISKLPQYIQEIISTSIAVQLVLAPLIIYYFQSAQIWALIANIIFTPLVTLILILAVFGLGFIVEPLLNLFKYLLKLSEQLPFIDTKLEIDFNSYVLLTLIFCYLAYLISKPSHDLNRINKFMRNKYIASALMLSLFMYLGAGTIMPPGVESIDLYHGSFKGKYASEINQFLNAKDGENYKYLKLAGLKTLIIKGKRNLKELASINGNIEEVQLLILPKLNSNDAYLDTLLDLSRPQFIICDIAKDSARARANTEIIASSATMILNSGKLYVGREKFWSIGSYE
jgi:ComEC/Rec2-related protein